MNTAGLIPTTGHPAGELKRGIRFDTAKPVLTHAPIDRQATRLRPDARRRLGSGRAYLKALQPTLARLDAALPVKSGVANSDIVRSYLGLLVQGKTDFDAIENLRGDAFYKQALAIASLPSSPTLRQRMDAKSVEMFDFAAPMIETLLAGRRPDYGVLACGWLPLDVDTFADPGCRGPFPC